MIRTPLMFMALCTSMIACGSSNDVVAAISQLDGNTVYGTILAAFGGNCNQLPPQWDTWPMAFHDSSHTGTSTDVVTPPLTVLWTWKDNYQFDLQKGAASPGLNLPIAFQDKLCFQGGLNSNRLFCLHQLDRSPAWEADNSGYTNSGIVYQFYNYPVMVGGRVIFGSVDYTTTVNAADGGGFLNLYNTNGGWPSGGLTGWSGHAYQQFVETDDGTEDFILYQAPVDLTGESRLHSGKTNNYDPRIPAVDPTIQTAYVNIGGQLMAFDANSFTNLWSWGVSTNGASPAAANGVVYFYANGPGTMNALMNGKVLWSTPLQNALSPIVSNGTLYVGSQDGNFYALNAANGAVLWKFHTAAPFTALQIPAISGPLIYVPAADGKIYVLNTSDGSLVNAFAGTTVWGPVIIANGMVFSSDATGTVYAFKPFSASMGK